MLNGETCEDDTNSVVRPSIMPDDLQRPPTPNFLLSPAILIKLQFENVIYKIKTGETRETTTWWWRSEGKHVEKTVLNGITGVVSPGEVLAMLGPSGSGKTSLLNALGGHLSGKVSGSILFNGQYLSKPMKRRTAFVTQDDILYPHLTVHDTLVYAALLRLPSTLSKDEKMRHVDTVIAELGLSGCRNTMIGGSVHRGVSGGERKRVSIGHEMLTNPSLLFLDEPTSGLDSTTAQRIVYTLQKLSRSGRTIVTTIHQPSSRLFYMFDKILLLAEGSPLYFGDAASAMDYLASIGHSPTIAMNPADFMLDLANGIASETRNGMENGDGQGTQKTIRQELALEFKNRLLPGIKVELDNATDTLASLTPQMDDNGKEKRGKEYWTTTWWEQFWVLLVRGLKERRHEAFGTLRVIQVLSISILAGLMWWQSKVSRIQDQVGLLFFFSIFWGFFPLYNAIFAFPQERAMLVKERSSGMYRLSAYFMARTAGDMPMELMLPAIFVVITYWMGGLRADAGVFLLTLAVVLYNVLVAEGLGLAIGAAVMEVKQATTLASVLMLGFLLAGGYYIHNIPAFLAWLKYVSFSYYTYKLLLTIQYSPDERYPCDHAGVAGVCRVDEFQGIRSVGLGGSVLCVGVLGVMLVGYRLLAYFFLTRLKAAP